MIIMTDIIGNYAGMIFFAIALVGVIMAIKRRSIVLRKSKAKNVESEPQTRYREVESVKTDADVDDLLDKLGKISDEKS